MRRQGFLSWLFLLLLGPASFAADLHHLPLGDGKVTTTAPQLGSVLVCSTAPFAQGRGARVDGPWIHGDSFDLEAKPRVEGRVTWPDARLSITRSESARVIVSNDLPSTPTGIFPAPRDSTAFGYDPNPNAIRPQQIAWTLPLLPAPAASPSCLPPGGPIGLLLDGSYLFNALDALGRDAAAHELQDGCYGHPEMRGAYHHHMLSPCLDLGDPKGSSPLIGYALDGFGIYGPYRDGRMLTNGDLDECHGTTSAVEWDGQRRVLYHYVANFEYPYTLGCWRGTPAARPRAGP
jgi:hypothetical protein